MLACIVLLCASALLPASEAQESKLVEICQGPVIGHKAQDENVFVFNSIPYATVPTGAQRFQAPLAPPTWEEPYDAIDKGIICPQFSVPAGKTAQEDCLVASVYVPNTNATNLPVMVIIHGGQFLVGYGDVTTPKQLVDSQKLIAATCNYRLGILGFLCMGTEDIPGNAGMKDQVACLQWVKHNIASFGGNPDDVTIVGCSAGGSSVDLLMLSKLTRGLFKKVIGMSSANVGVTSVQLDPVEYARIQARRFNYDAANLYDLEQFYKNASYELLISDPPLCLKNSSVVFTPCVERNMGQKMFLEDSPFNILKSGDYVKYPVLYGFTERDGLFRINYFDTWKNDMNKNFSEFLPADLTFKDPIIKELVAEIVKKFYFGNQVIGNDNVLQYVDYFTDVIFAYPMLRSLTLQVNAGNHKMYLHEYSFVDNDSALIPYANIRGAAHCAQGFAAVDQNYSNLSYQYKNMKSIIREEWINFAITGNPTPEGCTAIPQWPPANAYRSPCMVFGQTVELKPTVMPLRATLWDLIYALFYRNPIPPTPGF
ncbi:unnamed protein product [Chilo suppressalis]|uniref:Carboxylic ester hydrolase n=1 Tax=Chilo suppressalis TaxID=168631 RepID=A0ABN8BEG3_CHISP|nr:unnamed protein product [Chilo suppressalis]